MLPPLLQKLASLVVVVLILAAAVLGPCGEAVGNTAVDAPVFAVLDLDGGPGPCDDDPCRQCPDSDHSDAEECSCSCSCHPPLVVGGHDLQVRPFVVTRIPVEPFAELPDVYLPKFIPPQNIA